MGNCDWARASEAMRRYHDAEWGVPVHDDRRMFEHLMMECLQCGLSWELMLRKREVFRACFDGFDYDRIAGYGEEDIARILSTEGMIRSRRKVEAVVNNARCYQAVRAKHGSFTDWLWARCGGRSIRYASHGEGAVPVSNGLSKEIAGELKAMGFQYVGPVTVYSHLQACGIVNDHAADCPCCERISARFPTVCLPPDREVF